MNKYFNILSILLLVAAGCQLITADDKETSDAEEVAPLDQGLKENPVLNQFCYDVRSIVTSDLRGRASGLSDVMKGMIKVTQDQLTTYASKAGEGANQLDQLIAEGQKSVAKHLMENPIRPYGLTQGIHNGIRKLIKNPHAAYSKAENYLAERQRSFGRRLQENPVAPSSVIRSTIDQFTGLSSAIQERLRSLKGSAHERLLATLSETCDLVNGYQKEIQRLFEEAKKKDTSLADLDLEKVDCITLASVNSVIKACQASEAKPNAQQELEEKQ